MNVSLERGSRWGRLRVAAAGTAVATVGLVVVPGVASAATPGAASGSAVQRLAAAGAATVAGKTAKVGLSESASAAGKSVAVTGSGVLDFVHKSSDVKLALPGGAGSVEVRDVGSVVYVLVPSQARTKLPGHTPWISVDVPKVSMAELGNALGLQSGSQDPAHILGYLQGATSSVTTVGTATIGGVATTHLRATVDLRKLAASQGQGSQAVQALGTSTVPVDVYLDAKNRVRRMMLTLAVPATNGHQGGKLALTLNLSDFGAAVQISAPPASQTTDITQLVIAKARQVGQMPAGGASAGGGSTAGVEDIGLLTVGVVLLLGAAGFGLFGFRRRTTVS